MAMPPPSPYPTPEPMASEPEATEPDALSVWLAGLCWILLLLLIPLALLATGLEIGLLPGRPHG